MGSCSFQIGYRWLKEDKFHSLVENFWNATLVKGCASFRIAQKLKAIKNVIKVWAKEKKEKQNVEFSKIMEEINVLDNKESDVGLSLEDKEKRDSLKVKLVTILKAEESSWSKNLGRNRSKKETVIPNIFIPLLSKE